MKRQRQIRIGHSKKKNGLIDIHSKAHYGQWFDNKEFEEPDHNGDEDLEQVWKRKCHELNAQYPSLNHWVEHRYV